MTGSGRFRGPAEAPNGEPTLPAVDFLEEALPEDSQRPRPARRTVLLGALALAALATLTAAWQWTPLGQWLDAETLAGWEGKLGGWYAGLAVIGIFALGGLAAVPATILIAATALAFEPVQAFAYSTAGALASAALSYGAGRLLGADILDRLGGRHLRGVGRVLAHQGVLTFAVIRVVPIAPFPVVNAFAGAARAPLGPYLLGTFLGVMPGIFAITVLEKRTLRLLRNPGIEEFAALAACVVATVAAFAWIRRRIAKS